VGQVPKNVTVSLVTSSLSGAENDTRAEEDTPPHQMDSSVHTSGVLDAMLGLQELEDTMAETQWRNSEAYLSGQDMFMHSVHIGGVAMKKSRAIAQQFKYVTSAGSTDRLCHVAQESHFKTTVGLGVSHS